MKLAFLSPGNPQINQVTPPLERSELLSPAFISDIENLLDTAHGKQGSRDTAVLVGLAAPQVGVRRRVILVDTLAEGRGATGNLELFVNPVVTARSPEQELWYEGCYSTGHICGIVSRPRRISLTAWDRRGTAITGDFSGYTARVILHEIDHLDGIEFIHHVTNDDHLHWVEDTDWPKYRDAEGWREWPNKCPRSRWLEMKGR